MKIINDIPQDKKLYVIDFFATWCHNCTQKAKELESLEQEHKEVEFCQINVDVCPDNILNDFNVDNLPLIIAVKNGKEIARFDESKGDLKSWLHFIQW